jgi:uncharacterized membrane protein SpoIIM required for sporulation
MDLDAYSAAHRDEWDELARLGRTRHFTGRDADELIDHYQSGSSQFSDIKSSVGQSIEGERLSLGLTRARLRFTGAGRNVASRVPLFLGAQLPAALYRIRWLTIAVAALTATIAIIYAYWVLNTPGVLAAFGTSASQSDYVKAFVDYYSNYSSTSFASKVWTNNAWITAQSVAGGITGFYTPYVLFSNAQNIGISAGFLGSRGQLGTFFEYISPHGQLELYSIFVGGAAGLAIFWSWIAPGPRPRAQALAESGRALFTIAIGLIGSLLVSGIIEGFVTKQPWPWPIKTGIGTVALAGFLFYQWGIGGRAARAGHTGDLEEFEAGARNIVAG